MSMFLVFGSDPRGRFKFELGWIRKAASQDQTTSTSVHVFHLGCTTAMVSSHTDDMDGLFSLPTELRALIWQYCLPDRRHIVLSARPKRFAAPNVFHICHESRTQAQRHYQLTPAALGVRRRDTTTDYDDLRRHQIWVDFSRDTICVEGDWNLRPPRDKLSTTLWRAQSLAFEFCAPQNFMQLLDILAPVHGNLDNTPDLREVVLYSLPKKWFEDYHTGRVQERHPPLDNAHDAARILLRLLHMLFGGHAWLDSGAGIPPPLRWEFVSNDEANVWAGPFPHADSYDYVFRCASTGKFEIQQMDWEQLGQLRRVEPSEPRVHELVGSYKGCPEHDSALEL